MTPDWFNARIADKRPPEERRTELITSIFGLPPKGKFGAYAYSNLGFASVGAAIRPNEEIAMGSSHQSHNAHAGEGRAYAMGWAIITDKACANGPIIARDGSNSLWFERIEVAPNRGLAILTVSNDFARGEKPCVDLAAKLVAKFTA